MNPGSRPTLRPFGAGRLLWLALLLLAAACRGGGDDGAAGASPAGDGAALDATAPGAPPTDILDVLPATGSRGLVLNNCASCHALACLAVGRRSDAEWDRVEQDHLRTNPGMSAEDRGKIFDYLKDNFSNRQPEPVLPPEWLAGCP